MERVIPLVFYLFVFVISLLFWRRKWAQVTACAVVGIQWIMGIVSMALMLQG